MPADEHEYRQQLDELRDAAIRAMGHTHEVIDSLEEHTPATTCSPNHTGRSRRRPCACWRACWRNCTRASPNTPTRANGTLSASPSTRTPSASPPATPSHPMTRDSAWAAASTATGPSSKQAAAPSKPTPNKPTGSWMLAFQSMATGKTGIRRPVMSSNRMTRIIRLRHRRRMTTPAGHPRRRRR